MVTNTSTETPSTDWRPRLLLAVSMLSGACGVHRVQVSAPVPVRTRLPVAVTLDPATIGSATIPSRHGLPEVIISDVPALFRASLGGEHGDADSTLRLAILAIDFESKDPGDVHLARAGGASIVLVHGTPGTPKTATPSTPRYVRIKFAAEVLRQGARVTGVSGTVSGTERIRSSEEDVQRALGSAIEQLVAVLERNLLTPQTAWSAGAQRESLISAAAAGMQTTGDRVDRRGDAR